MIELNIIKLWEPLKYTVNVFKVTILLERVCGPQDRSDEVVTRAEFCSLLHLQQEVTELHMKTKRSWRRVAMKIQQQEGKCEEADGWSLDGSGSAAWSGPAVRTSGRRVKLLRQRSAQHIRFWSAETHSAFLYPVKECLSVEALLLFFSSSLLCVSRAEITESVIIENHLLYFIIP